MMTTVDVHHEGDRTLLVGRAHFTRHRGQVSTTFLYSPDWLANDGFAIDPALPLVAGSQHQSGLVRAFADSAPDRWGRNLIEKAERTRARQNSSPPRRLDDLDFLLGVSDNTRQGSLRFRPSGTSDFVAGPSRVPQLISLPQLLRAADDVATDTTPTAALAQLLDTGSTGLGGARPKASVLLEDGSLAMAKFPHSSDQWDVMAWEAVALDLLELNDLRTPARRLMRVGERSVLVLRRFDRTHGRRRIGYVSALTGLGATDGEQRDYADIATAVRDLCSRPQQELRELFVRVVISVALGNTDDHLRNHGFLRAGRGWELSPVFDVNPQPDAWRPRSTSIMGADAPPDEAGSLLELARECSVSDSEARDVMRTVSTTLADWRDVARRHRIAGREISMMAESIEPRRQSVASVAASS